MKRFAVRLMQPNRESPCVLSKQTRFSVQVIPMEKSRRIQREKKTVNVMIHHYCRLHHGTYMGLCSTCRELLQYAEKRLDNCPFQDKKTTCGKCSIHCYQPEKRKQIQKIMRTIGPRMILTNPIMSLWHIIDGLRKKPRK